MSSSPIAVTAAAIAVVALTTAAAASPAVEPEAISAVQRMRAYLSTLTMFEVRSDTRQDVVLDNGRKAQIDGVLIYRVRRPDAFEIHVVTGEKVRDFYFDGRQLTVYAPQLGYYAQAPASIQQSLGQACDRPGVGLPLEELLLWSQPGGRPIDVTSAVVVGDALINGEQTTQYAFRRGDLDWGVWILKGDRPLPLKITIVDRGDEARPASTLALTWNTHPAGAPDTFTFRPGKNDKLILLSAR